MNRAHPKAANLPPDIVSAINDAIVNGRKTYKQITEWLNAGGYDISESSMQRYGSKFLAKLERITQAREQAKSILETSAGLKTEMSEATSTVAFQLLMDMFVNTEAGPDGELNKNVIQAINAFSNLERSGTGREKLKFEYDKGVAAATEKITRAINDELKNHSDILDKINEILTAVNERE